MFRIEELLNLFQNDQEVMEIIKSAYIISKKNNKELSDIIFQQLLFLKSIQPNLNIKINHELNCPSNYNPQTNTINLNGLFDETTFFHELTHLFSYYYEKFKTPHEYNHLKNKFLSSDENTSIIILFLNLCQKEKQKLIKDDMSSVETKNNLIKKINNEYSENSYEYFIINKIEDIIDSIYSGKSHTHGLTYIKDNNSYTQKSFKSAGHGCDYFDKTGYEFEEIIADYQAIKAIAPNHPLFILLKQILGEQFILFLDERCQIINGEKPNELYLNNNTNKHKI